MRGVLLTLFLNVTSRLLLRRDRLNGTMKQVLSAFPFANERLVIPSGKRRLSAVYVSAGDDSAAVLICHGIGELVEYWGRVQDLLKGMGVSSLVFNYSGYGTSTGHLSTRHCEEDAIAACRELDTRGHRTIVLLGFSLGTGVAGAVASSVGIDGLILCQGFSTLREAALAMGFPLWVTRMVPDAWDTVRRACALDVPVLVVHSDVDGLFPLSMATRVAEACGERGELMIISGVSHNAPIFAPMEEYWKPIAEWVKMRASKVRAGTLPVARD